MKYHIQGGAERRRFFGNYFLRTDHRMGCPGLDLACVIGIIPDPFDPPNLTDDPCCDVNNPSGFSDFQFMNFRIKRLGIHFKKRRRPIFTADFPVAFFKGFPDMIPDHFIKACKRCIFHMF